MLWKCGEAHEYDCVQYDEPPPPPPHDVCTPRHEELDIEDVGAVAAAPAPPPHGSAGDAESGRVDDDGRLARGEGGRGAKSGSARTGGIELEHE